MCCFSTIRTPNFYMARAHEMASILFEREEAENKLKTAFAQVEKFLLCSLHVYFG